MKTVAIYTIEGRTKAKTDKAVLFERMNGSSIQMAWIPLSMCTLRYIGSNFKAKASVPDWFYNKISWKTA